MNKKDYINTWRKLDNTAKIFSLTNQRNTNMFRYSVLLKENVDKDKLKDALDLALDDYPEFKVKIGTGLFWHYLEFNPKETIIKKEKEIPCEHINFRKNNDYLLKVTYYKNKINLDVFHVLTDGAGAIIFLKSLIYHYLNLKYSLSINTKNEGNIKKCEDEYLKYYEKKVRKYYNNKQDSDKRDIFQLPGKPNKRINNTYHYTISIQDIKKICKKYNVTITEYLTAVYIYSLYLSIYDKKSNKEISITIPINLRNYFNNETLSNFFTHVDVIANVSKKNNISFDEILNHIHSEFNEKITLDNIKNYLRKDMKLGMNIPIRLVPLFIKKIFIKFMGVFVTKSSTSTLSNVGIIDIDKDYQKYIDNILVLVMPGKLQKIKCTICSYEDKLNITLNSNIKDKKLQKVFLKVLKQNIKKIKIESNK